MRLHRFFIVSKIDKENINSLSNPALVHQLRRVFRLHDGDKAIFFDGSGTDYVSKIVSMTDEELRFSVTESIVVKRSTERKVALAVSLIKKDGFEWIVQKGTELGVSEFIPLVSERSEKKGFNMERARKIMIEALEQSGRSDMSLIREPLALADFLAAEKRKIVAFHTLGNSSIYGTISKEGELVACIGPEGGWSQREVEMFREKGATLATLNTPILRAETAAVAVASILLAR